MTKLLVPIDFSTTSASALRYGCYLADVTGYDLEVLHVFDGYDGEESVVKKGSARVRARIREKIDSFVSEHADPRSFTALHDESGKLALIRSQELVGGTISRLVEQSHRDDVAMIVMGGVGTGLSGKVTPTFGSVARSVAMRSGCPVLLIPKIAGEPDLKRAAVAFDNTETLIELSRRTEGLRGALSLEMTFVHVVLDSSRAEEALERELTRALLRNAFPDYRADFEFLPPGDVTFALYDYTSEEDVDLLVMGRQPRNFLERLLNRSDISRLLGITGNPMLVVPLTDKSDSDEAE